MSDTRTIRDVLMDKIGYTPVGTLGKGFAVGLEFVIAALGLDPDTVLERLCPTCDGRRTIDTSIHARHVTVHQADECPDCNGSGWVEVNRVVVMPAPAYMVFAGTEDERALRIGRLVMQHSKAETAEENLRALRIGRAVLAMKKRHEGSGWMDEYEQGARDGYNSLLAHLLAAGGDDE